MATVLVIMPNYRLVLKVCFTNLNSFLYLPITYCNFGTQLETDASCECFSSKCPLILEDLKADVKLLTVNGEGEPEE